MYDCYESPELIVVCLDSDVVRTSEWTDYHDLGNPEGPGIGE